ncbi:Bifunctional purine biosynthesis protein PurH [Naganishia albida]|nr:Bifunctional purine biosynthesis protein PurH [Naganishia albida]
MGRYTLLQDIGLIVWTCLSSWYYGYHISELNFPETSITCSNAARSSAWGALPDCLGFTSTRYSAATAVFTLGGLMGSIMSSPVTRRLKPTGSIKVTGLLNVVGSLMMSAAPHWLVVLAGRIVVGLASGLAITTVPPLLSEISTTSTNKLIASHTGPIGILNQLAIVLGIFSAQVTGLALTGVKGDKRGGWRWIVLASGAIAIGQLVAGMAVPRALMQKRQAERKEWEMGQDEVDREVTCPEASEEGESSPLLQDSASTSAHPKQEQTLRSLLFSPTIRPHVLLVAFALITQQFAGINAVLFYSTPVLKSLLPDKSGLIGIFVSAINVGMTVPSLVLIDRIGRKPLLLSSLAGMAISAILLATGLDGHHQILSSITIITFVAAFALGLGPIPFLLISELVPPDAVPAVSSLALSCSWISNFVVALAFLPVRDALSYVDEQGQMQGEGRVFYLFLVVHVVAIGVIWKKLYRE